MPTIDWPAIVHGLQMFTLVTWAYPVLDKAPSVRRMLLGRPERWDAPWAAFWMVALTQMGFAARWLFFPQSFALWAACYLSSAMSCIGMVYTQGLTAGPARNRRALLAHICVLLICVAGAVVA